MTVKRTDSDIFKLLDTCNKYAEASKFPGMTYEDGIKAMYEWLFESGDNPMEE